MKSKTNGPTVQSFNLNFARLYDQVERAGSPPGNIWSGDEDYRVAAPDKP